MQLVVVGLVSIVVLIAFVALARHFGGAALLTAIGSAFAAAGTTFENICGLVYEDYIAPAFRKLGWYALGVMLIGVIGSMFLSLGATVTWWVWFVGLIITIITAAVLVWNGVGRFDFATRTLRWSTLDEFSVGTVMSAIVVGMLSLGTWFFAAAHICTGQATTANLPANLAPVMDAHSLAIMGAVFIALAIEVLFLVMELMAHLAKLGVDFAEGTSSLVISIAKSLIANGTKGLAGVGINIADQEGFKPAVARAKAKVKTAIMPILAVGCLMPYPAVLGFLMVSGAFTYFLFERMEAVGISTLERKQKASKLIETIGYVVLAGLALVVFVPPLQAEFDALILKIGVLLVGVVQAVIAGIEWILGIKTHTFTGFPWYAAMLGALFTGSIAYAIWPKNECGSAVVRRVRQAVALPLVVMTMAGVASLTVTIFSWGNADQVGIDNGITLSKMVAPKATLVSGTSPAVRLSYPEISRASGGYAYERRLITDPTWTALAVVEDGVAHFDDTTVVAGNTYAYRVAASFSGGLKEFSKETLVTVPAPAPVSSGSGGSGGSGGGSGARTACAGPSCGNPGLSAYCQRHPTIQGCAPYVK